MRRWALRNVKRRHRCRQLRQLSEGQVPQRCRWVHLRYLHRGCLQHCGHGVQLDSLHSVHVWHIRQCGHGHL